MKKKPCSEELRFLFFDKITLTLKIKTSKIFSMREESKRKMAEAIKNFEMPRYHKLPSGGLYLEQVTQYINGVLAPLGCTELTPSMVSNYVKKGIISGPVKRLYYTDQIAYLMFIAVAKTVLSMEQIMLLCEVQKVSYTEEVAYNYYCDELENMLYYVFGVKNTVEEVGVTTSDAKMMFRDMIIAAATRTHLISCLNAVQKEKEE